MSDLFDLVTGLPVHALVVHAVVVLLPLVVAGTIAVVVIPRWRRAYAPVVALLATAATAIIPVATQSGLALMRRVGPPAGAHQALGQQLIWFALPLTVLLWALVIADVRSRRMTDPVGQRQPVAAQVPASSDGGGSRLTTAQAATSVHNGGSHTPAAGPARVTNVIAVLALIAALATGFQVFRVGDSGARSVWGDVGTGGSAPNTSQSQ
ncbi:DUF2231 domain-containing protein [Georgenia yuyongxinii]|uniref:DUF2231 domain-containing protein n=1 Tax=Georgenia yuyongxinii TaxID=2589797 RepID=A0A552WLP8_9MICO|nr:DUF2231 domain-containing protein [Georgenia yuyongxinii]TRW43698.1 hypothetical protein FJ693_16645 [Georgenia yuyongxinii]